MTERDDNEEKPADSTEEYLLGGLDEDAEKAPPHRAVPPPQEDPPEDEPPAVPSTDKPAETPSADTPAGTPPEHPGHQPEQPAAEPGEYVEQGTEEMFAEEAARILDGGEVPDLDPVFRAALLESPESANPPVDETGEHTGEHTGEYTAEQDVPATGEVDQGTAEWEPPSETEITAEQTAVLAAAAKSDVHQAIETSRRTGEAWDPPRPPAGGDYDEPGKRRRYWWRFLAATVVIIFSFAAATSASILHELDDFAGKINKPDLNLPKKVLPDSNGGPQTIAILGSDVRTGGGASSDDPGRSDTTLLLRLDPDSGQIAMLSIPRDLKVEIPGHGVDKFNAAFTYGGPELTLKTIKSVTGLDVNHVINIDFQGFAEVVDAIHCVFIDVDQHYYHSNEGLAAADQYAEIDIEAGYQKLCGTDALEYARYRHGDSDLARAARQQDLVGEIRTRLSFSELLKQRKDLIKAFTNNTKTDIEGGNEILELLKLLFDSRSAGVVEVKFPSTFTLDNGVSYVEATPDEIEGAVDQFLGFEPSTGAVGTLDERGGATKDKKALKKAKKNRKKGREKSAPPSKEGDGLVDAATGGLDVAKSLDKEFKRRDFPVYYPKRLPEGTIYSEGSRTYHLRDPDKNPYSAYRMVMALPLADGTHYFGLQGIRKWEDPPILSAPHESIEMNDRDFDVYYEGDRIRRIAWHEDGDTYWLSNDILLSVENEQMLGMARSTRGFTAD